MGLFEQYFSSADEYQAMSILYNLREEMLHSIVTDFQNMIKGYVYHNIDVLTSVIVDEPVVVERWGGITNIYNLGHMQSETYAIMVSIVTLYANKIRTRLKELAIPDSMYMDDRLIPSDMNKVHELIQLLHSNPCLDIRSFQLGTSKTVSTDSGRDVYDVVHLEWGDVGYLARQYDVINTFVNGV